MKTAIQFSTPTAHYFDIFTAQFFHNDGRVLTLGRPEDYYPDVKDLALTRLERVLKKTGTIGASDELLCCM